MQKLFLNKISKPRQYIYSTLSVLFVAAICYLFSSYTGYRTIALVLLVTVSLIAMFFEIGPVLLASVLSALTWNFFFIPPKFTFRINSTEDALMFLMYFVVALINAVLTLKIRERNKSEQKKEEHENTLKLYGTLLNSLSHELRTPISTILGATDNLQSNPGKLSDDNKNELISEISKASLRLNEQVENLLNMSRLESGMLQLKRDWCDVNELIYEVINPLKEAAKNHHLRVDIKENLPLFKMDFGLIKQALNNLLTNALLYTPENSSIRIIADFDHRETGHFENDGTEHVELVCDECEDALKLIVEDNGKGLPDNELYNIFNKFYRQKNSRTGGTGLGLSIVKGFIEAHGGRVFAENIASSGLRFTMIIPSETSYLNSLKNE